MRTTIVIDKDAIQSELQELAGSFKVTVTVKPNGSGAGIYQTDRSFKVNFNPKHIKTQRQLDEHLSFVRGFISGMGGS